MSQNNKVDVNAQTVPQLIEVLRCAASESTPPRGGTRKVVGVALGGSSITAFVVYILTQLMSGNAAMAETKKDIQFIEKRVTASEEKQEKMLDVMNRIDKRTSIMANKMGVRTSDYE